MTVQQAWLAVISAEHAQRGVEGGFIQLNHGKRYGVARLRPGDGFVIYSPTERYQEKKPLRAFTALGTVADADLYQAPAMTMGTHGTVEPWRRRIDFLPAHPVALRDLTLQLTQSPHWGYQLRRGLVPLSPNDFETLQHAMVG
jgi:hypothetical protein